MWKLSTGLRNKLLGGKATVHAVAYASTISFGDGDGTDGRDTINDSGNGLGGFKQYDDITIVSGGGANAGIVAKILSVASGKIEVAAGTFTAVAAGTTVVLASASGGSYRGAFRGMVIDIYSGAQPSSADDAETGTKLCRLTVSSGAVTPGSVTNGLRLGDAAAGVIAKETADVWSGQNLASGVAGWFRMYDNNVTTGASTTAVRMDGSCATSGAQMNMTSTTLVSGVTTTVDSVALTQPAS